GLPGRAPRTPDRRTGARMSGIGPDTTGDEVVDVVVVGSGGGALAGALTTATRGLSTLVIEKTDRLGGTTAYSGGGGWIPGHHRGLEGGVPASVAPGRRYLRATAGDRSSLALQDAFLDAGPTLVAELDAHPRLDFEWRPFPDYFEAAPGGFTQGRS